MKTWSTLLVRGALASGAVLCALVVGCQGQHEGERCSLLNGNNDCVGDLVCTAASSLRLEDGVNRCCPDSGTPTDDRCLRRIGSGDGMGGMGGDTGAGGSSAGGSSSGGASSGGANGEIQCQYNSDCDDIGLVCGPTGVCQAECRETVDCDDGFVCSSELRCVAETP